MKLEYKGETIWIDEEDKELLNKYDWHIDESKGKKYMKYSKYLGMNGNKCEQENIRLHRLIMNAPSDKLVDHINHNGLDNRKQNLRIATSSQNAMNRISRPNSSSKYKGVSFKKQTKRWQANIRHKGKLKYLGYYKTEQQAAKAYNKAAKELFGEFAYLNTFEESDEV